MTAGDPPTGTFAGTVVLLVLGLLVLVPSGLCTGYFGIAGLATMFSPQSDQGYGILFLGGALILGGPFVAGSVAMVWIGIRRLRARS